MKPLAELYNVIRIIPTHAFVMAKSPPWALPMHLWLIGKTERFVVENKLMHKFSLHRKEWWEEMLLFAVTTNLSTACDNLLKTKLLKKYEEFVDIKFKASTLPKHQHYDCPIDLQPRKEPLWGPTYKLSPIELEDLWPYIEANLANGFIQYSRSLDGAPVPFMKKKDGSISWIEIFHLYKKI